jgi:hypothetical protein
MAKKLLSEKDIDQLLSHYRSERRKLSFQLETVRTAILDLKRTKGSLPASATTSAPKVAGVKRGPGRPRNVGGSAPVAKARRKAKPAKKSARGPGRPPKRERKVRDLNPWDIMVLDAIKNTGRLLPKEDLLNHAVAWAAKHEPAMSPAEVEAFLTRTLQKLSGRKKALGTHHTGLRRGYHYGLKDWFFSSSGKLRRQHYDKLVLTED